MALNENGKGHWLQFDPTINAGHLVTFGTFAIAMLFAVLHFNSEQTKDRKDIDYSMKEMHDVRVQLQAHQETIYALKENQVKLTTILENLTKHDTKN